MIDKRLPLFKIAANIFESVSFDDIQKTAEDMEQLEIYSPPFDEFYIQGNWKFICNLLKSGADTPIEDLISGGSPLVTDLIFHYRYDGKYIHALILRSFNGVDFIDVPQEMLEGDDRFWSEWVTFATVKLLVVLLATKNIKKEVQTCNKPNSRNRRERKLSQYSSVTTISIGKITETMRSVGANGGSVRPHLRRGHIRSQPFGKGRSETKKYLSSRCSSMQIRVGLTHKKNTGWWHDHDRRFPIRLRRSYRVGQDVSGAWPSGRPGHAPVRQQHAVEAPSPAQVA